MQFDQSEQVTKYPCFFDEDGGVTPHDILKYFEAEFEGVLDVTQPFVEEPKKFLNLQLDDNQTVLLGMEPQDQNELGHYVRAESFGSNGLPLKLMDPTAKHMQSMIFYDDWEITTAFLLTLNLRD